MVTNHNIALMNARRQGRMPHALLLLGNRGAGQQDFAKILAQQLLCHRGDDQACGSCRACELFLAGNHPDYFYIAPQMPDSKTIKIDQMRTLISQITQSPHQSQMQVVVIDPAENMTAASAHAFLKTLEEPPGDVIFILISTRLGSLLPTIVSRCQRLQFTAQNAIEFSNPEYEQLYASLLSQLTECIHHNMHVIHAAAQLKNSSFPIIIHSLLSILLDIARLKSGVFSRESSQAQERNLHSGLVTLSTHLSFQQLFKLWQHVNTAYRAIENGTAINTQLFLENIYMSIG